MINTILQGDSLTVLKTLPDGLIDCVVTSPPYWGLRDYGTAKWKGGDPGCAHVHFSRGNNGNGGETSTLTGKGAPYHEQDRNRDLYRKICEKCGAVRIDNQLGLEPTIEEYIDKMTVVFREVRRVLKDTGTLWLNMGDAYAGGGRAGQRGIAYGGIEAKRIADGRIYGPPTGKMEGLKPKDLIGQPWRLAFALQADGWYLRSDIIWHKPNPMPESVTDRPTKSHEYVFLMSKKAHYFYDADAVREEGAGRLQEQSYHNPDNKKYDAIPHPRWKDQFDGRVWGNPAGRNKRTVWTIATQSYPEAHFATFPEKLVEPCIRAGTSERGYCAECGLPWMRVVEDGAFHPTGGSKGNARGSKNPQFTSGMQPGFKDKITIGWQPTCACSADTVPGLVLDPFFGSGTVGVVAAKNGRNYLGIELNPEYIKLAKKRIPTRQEQLIF